MENVVYFLGAGFSAPSGLPVTSNFLSKSKDMFSAYPVKYKYFKRVFDRINDLHKSKSYYETDLLNIEEILSILDMESLLQRNNLKQMFQDYISDVISFCTPKMKLSEIKAANWYDFIFGNEKDREFASFICSLLGIILQEHNENDYGLRIKSIRSKIESTDNIKYSIVTPNYDMIVENIVGFINNNYPCIDKDAVTVKKIGIGNTLNEYIDSTNPKMCIAKLHGSIDKNNIVPPTWNKNIGNRDIKEAWRLASKMLVDANYIRIIGYSFPPTDTYVKYLFKSAVIDCLCWDQDGSVEKRFNEFVVFRDKRFINMRTENYLEKIGMKVDNKFTSNVVVKFVSLESSHNNIFSNR